MAEKLPVIIDNRRGDAALRDCVVRQLQDIRLRLLDLGNRNRLLNFKHNSRCIKIVDEQLGQVFDHLVRQGKPMKFLAIPEDVDAEDVSEEDQRTQLFTETGGSPPIDLIEDLPLPEYPDGEIPERHRDDKLQTTLEADFLETRLRRIRSDASSIIQETGTNQLFLALGFLRWKERADTAESREAPLILVPVEIGLPKLNRRTQRYTYSIQYTGEDLVPNLSLREKLFRDHKLGLPMFNEEKTIAAAVEEEELDPEAYFDVIAEAVAEMPGWEVRRKMVVGFFTFAKLRMYLDLDPEVWPDSCIADHDLVQRLLGCKEHPPDVDEETGADETLEVDSLPLVMDADSSQSRAIHRAVVSGQSMVIQGPPGTGKSQTITNLIACFLAQGKSVLFLAEKMAALTVVQNNMKSVGLSTFCLELHSHKADKKAVIENLETSYEERNRLSRTRVDLSLDMAALKKARDSLAGYIELIKKPVGPAGETVFGVFGKVEMLRYKLSEIVPLQIENIDGITYEQIENAQDLIRTLSRTISEIGLPASGPWYGYNPVELIGGDENTVLQRFQVILTTTAKFLDEARALFEQIETPIQASELTYGQLQRICELDPDQVPSGLLTDLAGMVLAGCDEREWKKAKSWKSSIHEYWRKIEDASKFLKQPDKLAFADIDRLSGAAKQISTYGIASLNLVSAQELRDTCTRLLPLLNEFQKLVEVPVAAGLPKPRTIMDITRFTRLESVIRGRPRAMSREVCKKLLTPSLRVIFTKMVEEGQRLTRMRQELSLTFAIDDVCPRDELVAVRQFLRRAQGRWFKALSSEYRQGMRALRSFLRQPSQAGYHGMAERLETLEKFLAEQSEFSLFDQYRETFIGLFKGLETDWSRVKTAVTWVTNVCDICGSVEVAAGLIDLEIDGQDGWPAEREILHVVTQIERELSRCTDIVSGISDKNIVTSFGHEPIETLRNRLQELACAVTTVEEFLAGDAFEKNATLSDILDAAHLECEANGLRAKIEQDQTMKSLTGRHFNGVDTDIDGIVETISWALSIRNMGLPLELVNKMSQVKPQALINSVGEHAATWARDSTTISQSLNRLGDFGPLDMARFLGNSLEDIRLGELQSRIERAVSNIGCLARWAEYWRVVRRAQEAGLGVVVRLMESGNLDPMKATDTYSYTVYNSIARNVLRKHPKLSTFTRIEYESKRKLFAELDAKLLQRHRQEIAYKASLGKVPPGTTGPRRRDLSDMYLLKAEFGKQRRHLPIRQLMDRAGKAVKSLKPVFMMSPMSVAQFLEPGKHTFDVVIMDEASQIQPPDALGAIARTKQMIVVGDRKQLPPTNFFERMMNNPDDDQDEEAIFNSFDAGESILDKCEQLDFPREPLLWHYRSEHESLIAFSNARWYGNKLVIFPSSGVSSDKLGIVFHYIKDGAYTSGRNVNEVEGAEVARKIIEHARRSPHLSLGVGTLNLKQRILIEDMLARFTKDDPTAESSLAKLNEAHEGTEPLFIKNLENLQGDQRDVIFVSCTFGPNKETGKLSMHFGPIVQANGWRRLNVLITRAKKRVEVFTSMRPEDITAEPGQEGRLALREYLKYAETGQLPELTYVRPPDSDFELAVAQVVRNLGYQVEPQVGVAGYFVDIGVRNPHRPAEYILGIECDGATYHSSAYARDRDRLREEVLRRRGWEIHRIWSTDWFKNREPEIVRLKKKLEQLVQKSTPEIVEWAKPEEWKPATAPPAQPRLTDDELRARIGIFCRENIPRPEEAQKIDGFLNPVVLHALVRYRITNRNAFREYIPVEVRAAYNSDDLQYLDDIFEIIE